MHQDLFGSGEAAVHNVFFGLLPDAVTRDRMARTAGALQARNDLQGRWLKPARYHMTLHFLGTFSELPRERIAAACQAGEAVRMPAFDLVLDRAGHFNKGIGWLGCSQTDPSLRQLWEELRRTLARAHVGALGHATFKPHVTIVRDARTALPVEPIEPIRWPVREIVLIDSQLGERNEYRPLGRWMLGQEA